MNKLNVRARIVETRKGDVALAKHQGATLHLAGDTFINHVSGHMPNFETRTNFMYLHATDRGFFFKERKRNFIVIPEMYGCIYQPVVGPDGYSWYYREYVDSANEDFIGLSGPPEHWLQDGDWWRMLGGEVTMNNDGIPTVDPTYYFYWLRDKRNYSMSYSVQDHIGYTVDEAKDVSLLVKHSCTIYNNQCLAVNAPVMFGFMLRNSDSINLGESQVLAEIKIRTLANLLPSAYAGKRENWNLDNWESFTKAEHLYIELYTDRVVVSTGEEVWNTLDLTNLQRVNNKILTSFSSNLGMNKPDGYWSDYIYIGLIPLGDTILLMYNVNGNITYHPFRFRRTLPLSMADFSDDSLGPLGWGVISFDEETKNFYRSFSVENYANSHTKPDERKLTVTNPIIWEHWAGVMVTMAESFCPVNVVVCPMLFKMYPESQELPLIASDISFLGYKPTVNYDAWLSQYQPEISSEPNPEVKFAANIQDRSSQIRVYHINDYWSDEDGANPDSTFMDQTAVTILSTYKTDPERSYNWMISSATGLGINDVSSDLYSTTTPLIKMIRRKFQPEHTQQAIEDTDRYLEVDILNLERSNVLDSGENSIAIEKLNISILCYDANHVFLKTGKHIRVVVGINDNEIDLGHYVITKVTRSRNDVASVLIKLECRSILSQIDRTPIINCDVFDGRDPREVVEELLRFADLNFVSKTEPDPDYPDRKLIDSRFLKMRKKLSTEKLIPLPYSTTSRGPNFRPRFGSKVRSHLEKILKYTGYRIDIDADGIVWFFPRLSPKEQELKAFFVDDYDGMETNLRKLGFLTEVQVSDSGIHYVTVVDYPEEYCPLIPFSSLEEIETDDLATRVLVIGPNLNLDKYVSEQHGARKATSIALPSILSGYNMAVMKNVDLEKEMGEVRYAIYADRNLVSGHTVRDLAEYLFTLLGRRRQFYQLEIPDISMYPNISLYDKVKIYSSTNALMSQNLDSMNLDISGNQLGGFPCETGYWQDYFVSGYNIRHDKFSVGGTVYLMPFVPIFGTVGIDDPGEFWNSSLYDLKVVTSPNLGSTF